MKYIYLFCEGARAADYGIGTYINQLKTCLLPMKDIALNIVYINSGKEEFMLQEDGAYRSFYFPFGYDYFNEPTVPAYMRSVWSLLLPYIKVSDTDHLIFHFNFFQEHPLVKLAKQDFPFCKTVLTIHYMNWCFLLKGNTSYFRKIISRDITAITDEKEKEAYQLYESEGNMLMDVDHIICLAKYTENLLVDTFLIPREKLSVIYNGLDDTDISLLTDGQKKQLKASLYIPENEKIILFVGRLDEIKGANIVIDAFKQVLEVYPESRLIVVGGGDFTTYLNEAKGYWNKMILTGKIKKDNLYKFYQIADIGVIPSMHEQCSYVGIEMMAFGLPILGTTSTGLNEMLPDQEGFYKLEIVEKENDIIISTTECARSLLSILTSGKDFAKNTRKYFRQNYSLSVFCKNMTTFYKTIE